MERIVIIAAALAATISTAASDELVVKVGKLDATYDTTAVPVEVQNNNQDRTGSYSNRIHVTCALFFDGELVGLAKASIEAAPGELVYDVAYREGRANSAKCKAK
jgi:hypothetical protein